MNITIKIIYRGWKARIMQRGSFLVDPFEFEIDPDREAARVAFEWLKLIRKEGYISEIIVVTYNEEHDITELVK